MTTAAQIPVSVLDLAPVSDGSDARTALRNTLELAQRADEWGYHRYWVAEHHNMPGIASAAPAVLIGHIADVTSRLRVGSGGVMLPNHAPLVVAEQFGILEALHPGRIDLGIGRAPGTDPVTAAALRRTSGPLSADDFPEQLTELQEYFAGSATLLATPAVGNGPPLWLLGSSGHSAHVAGLLGLPFAFAHHFSPANTLPALQLYRSTFRPSAHLAQPYAMIGAAVVCAETDERARWLAAPGGLSFLRLRTGKPGPFPTPEEAAAHPYTDAEQAVIDDRMATHIVGAPDTVAEQIGELLQATAADELMVTTMVHDPKDRLWSYQKLAELLIDTAPEE